MRNWSLSSWLLAALKPSKIGVSEYRDPVREYLEIAVLSPSVRTGRLAELIHRAIPYPVLLIATRGEEAVISLVHKRFAQNEFGQTVMDGLVVSSPALGTLPSDASNEIGAAFLMSLALSDQPRVHLCALYVGWIECVEAFQAARFSGRFVLRPGTQRQSNWTFDLSRPNVVSDRPPM